MARKSKVVVNGYINSSGEWIGFEGLRQKVNKAFNGKKVTATFQEKKIFKTNDQLGYFYGVVIPYYVYALVRSQGAGLSVRSKADRDIVVTALKEKHLDNGPVWVHGERQHKILATSSVDGHFLIDVQEYATVGEREVIAIADNGSRDHTPIISNYAGVFNPKLAIGVELKEGELIGTVSTEMTVKGPSSLADASKGDVVKMIDKIKQEAAFMEVIIPDSDPLYESPDGGLIENLAKELESLGHTQ